jgi:hypothetical protein
VDAFSMMTVIGWLIGLGTFVLMAILVVHVLLALLLIVPSWRILERAGFSGLLSLFHLMPVVGPFIVMAILAFSDWPNGEGRPQPVRPHQRVRAGRHRAGRLDVLAHRRQGGAAGLDRSRRHPAHPDRDRLPGVADPALGVRLHALAAR